MCGIAGYINLKGEPASSATIRKMMDAIAHRGPDGEGQWIEGPVAIGHRRLAIIDLSSAGRQPMLSDDKRYILSYNGEIYNYRELRKDLIAEGYRFCSSSDSEVVLYAFSKWGTKALLKFNGMFSLSLFDRKKNKLLIARDRYGIKPLYYALQDNRFSFGSEQKAITAQSKFKRKLNKAALLEYFTFQNLFTDQTLLEGITLLPSGHYAEVDVSSGHLTQYKYWDYEFSDPDYPVDKNEYVDELDRLFRQAVNRQLVSDVELGCYLSGGMDSGSITAIAAQNFPNLKSFTVGFDLSSAAGSELGFDERFQAESMSAKFKTEQYQMVLKSQDMERCLSKLAWHLEEPRVGQSYPNYYASQLASKFVKVVLSGGGGDELFGGYPWRYYRATVCDNFEHYIDQYYAFWQRLIPNKEIHRIFSPVWSDVKDVWTRDIFRDVFLSHKNQLDSPKDYINHSLYFEAKTFLHGLFVVEDKLSMAHSLETRVPFMDNDLVEFAMKCPISLKLNNLENVVRFNENEAGNKQKNYFLKTNDGKQILRDMMARYIPENITKAEKKGFSSPDASWFKGESVNFVRDKLFNKHAHIYEVLNRKAVSELAEQHFKGEHNRRLLIWSLLNVEAWMEEYLYS